LEEVGRSVARFAWVYNNQKAKEFIKAIEEGTENPGADPLQKIVPKRKRQSEVA
jgi:hypothetical protein